MKKVFNFLLSIGAAAFCGCACRNVDAQKSNDKIILWEAHRGGGGFELPESTPVGFEYAWMLGGTPEADVNMTKDKVIMSLHDGNLKRTARNVSSDVADKDISEMTFAEVKKYDIGNDAYPGQSVPALHELLQKLADDPEKEIIIDYKNVPLDLLSALIDKYGVAKQITFATTDEDIASEFKKLQPYVRIKIWLGGSRERIMERFRKLAAANFKGFEQVQLHLNRIADHQNCEWIYGIKPEDLREALEVTQKHGVLLQVLPWKFEKKDIFAVLDLGVRSFAVDYPNKFCMICAEYFAAEWQK